MFLILFIHVTLRPSKRPQAQHLIFSKQKAALAFKPPNLRFLPQSVLFPGRNSSKCSPDQYYGASPPICALKRRQLSHQLSRNELACTKPPGCEHHNNPILISFSRLTLVCHSTRTILRPRDPRIQVRPPNQHNNAMTSPPRSSHCHQHSPRQLKSPRPSWNSFLIWLAKNRTTLSLSSTLDLTS